MSMETLDSTDAVFDALGGPGRVAQITGRKYSAAWNWKKGAKFPANTYLTIQGELSQIGKRADPALWGMAAPSEGAA